MSPADHLDSGFLSDLRSDEEEEVDAIVSQALDNVALEQIAALNTAHLLPPSSSPRPLRQLNSPPQALPPLSPPPSKASVTPIVPDPKALRATPHSPSPPRGCCFGFSPRGGRKKVGGNPRTTVVEEWGKEGEELLEEVRAFSSSTKEQRRRVKEAMREVEKASREAEKLAELVREVSVRMDFAAGLEDLMLSDGDVEEDKGSK